MQPLREVGQEVYVVAKKNNRANLHKCFEERRKFTTRTENITKAKQHRDNQNNRYYTNINGHNNTGSSKRYIDKLT